MKINKVKDFKRHGLVSVVGLWGWIKAHDTVVHGFVGRIEL